MEILLTGGTGFIGRHLCPMLLDAGHHVTVLSRNPARAATLLDTRVNIIDRLDALQDTAIIDGIVNLAGAPIMGMPWTAGRRQQILGSRLRTTQALVDLIARLDKKPQVLVSGSAIGYYGIGDHTMTESDGPTAIFQSQLCAQWEQSAAQAQAHGTRVCYLRTGVVLAKDGGALPRLALPVKFGVGSILGNGQQWLSWIHLDDMLRLICFALENAGVQGPLNATAPEPVTHRDMMRALATVLHRPLFLKVPAFLLRTMMGEMSQLLLEGQRVLPERTVASGFTFRYPALEPALRAIFAPR